MGEISITIPLAWIYIPLIIFFSFITLRFILRKISRVYIRYNYRKKIRPEILYFLVKKITEMEKGESKGYEYDTSEFIVEPFNDHMSEFLGKRKKLGGSWRDIYDKDWMRIENVMLGYKIPVPFMGWVAEDMEEDIWLEKVKEDLRESNINSLLGDE